MDAHGGLRQILLDANGTIYGAGFMTVQVPLLAHGQKRTPTFYHQHGDWFGWSCVVLSALMLARRIARSRFTARKT